MAPTEVCTTTPMDMGDMSYAIAHAVCWKCSEVTGGPFVWPVTLHKGEVALARDDMLMVPCPSCSNPTLVYVTNV